MAVAYDKKNKRYYIDAMIKRPDGTRYHYVYKDNHNDNFKSKRYVASIEFEVVEKRKKELLKPYKKGYTLELLLNDFIKSKSNDLAKNTLNCYKYFFENYYSKVFSNKPIQESLSALTCLKFRNFLGENNEISNVYKNKCLGCLRNIISFARKIKQIDSETKDDCIENLEPFKKELTKKEPVNKYTPLTDLKKLLDNITDIDFKDTITFMYFLGLRIGEFLGIKCKYITFEENVARIEINGQRMEDGTYTTRLKTSTSYKNVYLTGKNAVLLRNYIERNKLSGDDYLIQYSRSNLRRKLNDIFTKTGIERNTFHGLGRKSINTEMYYRTGDIKVCQSLLGQSSASVNLNHYVSDEKAKEKMLNSLNELSTSIT